MAENLPALQQKAVTLRDYLNDDRIKGQLELALPKWMSIDRLLRIVFTSTMKNPKLLDCTKESLLQSIMQCAQLGLEPILGRAYLIPYKNKKQINGQWQKVLECQFQPGYQGLVDLARRSGQVKDVYAQVVYENDEFLIEYGTERKLSHKPHLGNNPGDPIGAYAVWESTDGLKSFEFMPLHEIYKRRDKSQAYQFAESGNAGSGGSKKDSIWHVWEGEQMRKTVIKHSAKLQPASIEIMEAVELDDSADLGRSQLGMFTGSPEYAALEAPPLPTEPDTSEFDELLSQKVVPDDLSLPKFLAITAKANDTTIPNLKVRAGENFDAFWVAFEAWQAKQEPEKQATQGTALQCDCGFWAKTERGLKKHITQQHGGEPEKTAQGPGPDDTEVKQQAKLTEEQQEEVEIGMTLAAVRAFGGDITAAAKAELGMTVLPNTLDGANALKDKCSELYNAQNRAV